MTIPTPSQRGLKRSTRDLVEDVGGLECAARDLDKGKSTVHRWTDRHDDEHFINVGDLRTLEAGASQPFVTMQLCRLAGGVFVRLPEAAGDEALATQVLVIAKELGDVSAAIMEGLADGKMTDAEKLRALDQLHDLDTASATLRLMLAVPPHGADREEQS